jgi:hypothetical protein
LSHKFSLSNYGTNSSISFSEDRYSKFSFKKRIAHCNIQRQADDAHKMRTAEHWTGGNYNSEKTAKYWTEGQQNIGEMDSTLDQQNIVQRVCRILDRGSAEYLTGWHNVRQGSIEYWRRVRRISDRRRQI